MVRIWWHVVAAVVTRLRLDLLVNPTIPPARASGGELLPFLQAVPEHVLVVLDEVYLGSMWRMRITLTVPRCWLRSLMIVTELFRAGSVWRLSGLVMPSAFADLVESRSMWCPSTSTVWLAASWLLLKTMIM